MDTPSTIANDETKTTSATPPPPLNDTTTDFVEINNAQATDESKLDESAVQKDELAEHNLDENELKEACDAANAITESTLVITKSQIIDDDLNKSCEYLGDELNESKTRDDDDEVRDSIEVLHKEKRDDNTSEDDDKNEHNKTLDEFVQPTSEDVKSSSQAAGLAESKLENEEREQPQTMNDLLKEEVERAVASAVKNTSLDEDNLEKDYEITNGTDSLTNTTNNNTNAASNLTKSEQFVNLDSAELAETQQASKRVRNLADEVYEQPLGSDSLLKKIVQYGDEDTRPHNGQMCTISYKAFIKDTDQLVEQDDDLSFILGDGDVIPAIDLVVSLMDKNEICEVVAEARHAYGKLGKKIPPKTAATSASTLFIEIPPDSTLFLRIHLKEYSSVTETTLMKPVERLSLAEAKKLRGNYYFNRQEYYLADLSYKKGLNYFNEENLTGEEETADIEKFLDLRKALLMNLSLSKFKQTEYRNALSTLDELLLVQRNHVKALFVKGKCLMNLGETKEALECLTKCYELDKTNQDVKNELTKAQAKYKTQYENEKKMYQKMMSGVSPDAKNESKPKSKSKSSKLKTTNSDTDANSSYKSYVLAGLAVAAVSIGITMLAKYKNMI